MSFLQTLFNIESGGGKNIANTTQGTSSGQAQGYFQITTGTWNEFGGQQFAPTPLQASYSQQAAIASQIPLGRWDPITISALRAGGYNVDPSQTLGQNLANNGENINLGPIGASTSPDPNAGGFPGVNYAGSDAPGTYQLGSLSGVTDPNAANYGDITGYNVAGVNTSDTGGIGSDANAVSDPSGIGSQSDAIVGTLGTNIGQPAAGGIGSDAVASGNTNDQQFNQPDPSKVQVTDIASSGLVGQEKVAGATTGAGTAVQTGLGTAGQDVITSEQQAVSGLGDLFARGSLVVIGLLLLGGAFVFYALQNKSVQTAVKAAI